MGTILRILVLSSALTQLLAKEEFDLYTHVSIRDDNGQPCLTGCSPITGQCFINWKREKSNCTLLEDPAPIYLTSQYKDSERKHCLSNCGPYDDNYEYEWCFTRKDFSKWDYCSTETYRGFMWTGKPQGMTAYKKKCTDQCSKGRDTYFWCHYKDENFVQKWDTCALHALPRIPVLHSNFFAGEKNKAKCDYFFKYDTDLDPSLYSSSVEAADNYVISIAEAIEATGNNVLTQVFKLDVVNNPIESYSMVTIKDIRVPAVIRAHITKDSINIILNDTEASPKVERKLRQQMSNIGDSYEAGTLIGFDLGGPNAEYNLVPRPLGWKCDDWADMEEAAINWCRITGGSVDMLIVVFYRDDKTPIPRAFGVSQVFKNIDQSTFVDCREKIYWNNF